MKKITIYRNYAVDMIFAGLEFMLLFYFDEMNAGIEVKTLIVFDLIFRLAYRNIYASVVYIIYRIAIMIVIAYQSYILVGLKLYTLDSMRYLVLKSTFAIYLLILISEFFAYREHISHYRELHAKGLYSMSECFYNADSYNTECILPLSTLQKVVQWINVLPMMLVMFVLFIEGNYESVFEKSASAYLPWMLSCMFAIKAIKDIFSLMFFFFHVKPIINQGYISQVEVDIL